MSPSSLRIFSCAHLLLYTIILKAWSYFSHFFVLRFTDFADAQMKPTDHHSHSVDKSVRTGSSNRRLPDTNTKVNTKVKSNDEVLSPNLTVTTKSSKKKRCTSPDTKPVPKKRAVSVKASTSVKKLQVSLKDSKGLSEKKNEVKMTKEKVCAVSFICSNLFQFVQALRNSSHVIFVL